MKNVICMETASRWMRFAALMVNHFPGCDFFPFPHSAPTPAQVYLDHIPRLLMKAPCKPERVAGWADTSSLLILEENILIFILWLCQPGSLQQAADEQEGKEVPVDVALWRPREAPGGSMLGQ